MNSELLHQKELAGEHKIFEYHGIVNIENNEEVIENIKAITKFSNLDTIIYIIEYCFRNCIPFSKCSIVIGLYENETLVFLEYDFSPEQKQKLHELLVPEIRKEYGMSKEELKKRYKEILMNEEVSNKSGGEFRAMIEYIIAKKTKKTLHFENIDEQTFLCSLAIWYSVNKSLRAESS